MKRFAVSVAAAATIAADVAKRPTERCDKKLKKKERQRERSIIVGRWKGIGGREADLRPLQIAQGDPVLTHYPRECGSIIRFFPLFALFSEILEFRSRKYTELSSLNFVAQIRRGYTAVRNVTRAQCFIPISS